MILLKCAGSSGQVAFAAATIDGHDAPARSYDVIDGFLAIDHEDTYIATHDANELCSGAHPAFRLATADEQDAYAAKQKKTKNLREKAQPTTEAPAPPIPPKGG